MVILIIIRKQYKMEKFKIYLKNVANIPDKYIPFYIHWVKAAYNFLELNLNTELSQKQTKTFIQKLSVNHPDWQIKQAQSALRHYQFFLQKNRQSENTTIEPSTDLFMGKNHPVNDPKSSIKTSLIQYRKILPEMDPGI